MVSARRPAARDRVGVPAAHALLAEIIRRAPRGQDSPWELPIWRTVNDAGTRVAHMLRNDSPSLMRLRFFLHEAVRAERPCVLPLQITQLVPSATPGRRREQYAQLGFHYIVDLENLFRPGGPLHAEMGRHEYDAFGHMKLGARHLSVAAQFMDRHLSRSIVRPVAVLESGWRWHLLFLFKKAVFLDEANQRDLDQIAELLRRFLHTAKPVALDGQMSIDGMLVRSRLGTYTLALRTLRPANRFEPGGFGKRAVRLLKTLGRLAAEAPQRGKGAVPPEMGLRTLPLDWTLADWDLGPRLKQLCSSGVDPDGCMAGDLVLDVMALAARRGYGWRDVELLLHAPMHGIGTLVGLITHSEVALKSLFRRELSRRDPRFPTRLPWGIRLAHIHGRQPDERPRYRVYARRSGRDVHRDVAFDRLLSAARLRTVVAEMVEGIPEPIPQKAWDKLLTIALADPRCMPVVRDKDGKPVRPLTAWIQEFLSRAQPYVPPHEGLSSSDPSGWPLIRDGVAVYPRKVLEQFLADQGVGRVGRHELTQAIESLGGGPRGVCYFGGSGRIRVWATPLPSTRTA